jgi:hypothetical protein
VEFESIPKTGTWKPVKRPRGAPAPGGDENATIQKLHRRAAVGEIPQPLKSAHALQPSAAGKRSRPVCFWKLPSDSGRWATAMPYAAGGRDHTFSLIHDVLPALGDELTARQADKHACLRRKRRRVAGVALYSLGVPCSNRACYRPSPLAGRDGESHAARACAA